MKKMFKKLLSLAVVFVLTLTASIFPVSAYPSKVDEDIPVIEMVEVADGIYEFEMPLQTTVTITNSEDTPYSGYADYSSQYITKLYGKYYVEDRVLSMSVTVSQKYSLIPPLLKYMVGTLGYKQYDFENRLIDQNERDVGDKLDIPFFSNTLQTDFTYVVALPEQDEYFILSAEGEFELIDGFGGFSGSAYFYL